MTDLASRTDADGAGEFDSPAPLSPDARIDRRRVLPSRSNRQVAVASEVIGGPVGRHAAIGRNRTWTPLRVLFLMALIALAFGWFGKAGCIQQAPVAQGDDHTAGAERLNWDNQRQFYGLCYTDIVAFYSSQRLSVEDLRDGTMPYRTYWVTDSDGRQVRHYVDQPVLIGGFMYAAAKATQGWQARVAHTPLPKQLDAVTFFNISAILLAFFWLIAVWATMLTARRRMWVAALMALSPLAILHAFTAFEIIPVMLVALAMLAWSRDRVILTGLFVGLAASAGMYPLLLLPALLVICVRSRRLGDFAAICVTAVLAWAAVNVPVLIAYPRGWGEYFRVWWQRGAQPDSLYQVIGELAGHTPSPTLVNALSLTLTGVVIAGVVYVGLRAARTPSPAQLMFLLVAGYLLVGSAWSPQSSLWLVPLAVLAIPYPRALLAWMVIDALVWVPRMTLFLDADRRWLPKQWFELAVLVRAVAVIALCVLVVRALLIRPEPAVTGSPSPSSPRPSSQQPSSGPTSSSGQPSSSLTASPAPTVG
ncbi:glycosyltransferase family 87 protein [Gordonia sp. (in: high G+C Gram-positive bacteria)]|uniref:glycosyltransferase family 87 protein n=1 Tax=Gordonia sp. (in: high G+C Gram-positive bacteria) TaxID=84139 RepID=UPI0039E47ABF